MDIRRFAQIACLLLTAAIAAPASAQLFSRFGDVQWIDADGNARTLAAYRGHPVIMTMSYTSCRKTCSNSMLVLRRIQQILDRRGQQASFVIVSYDPQHDSPEQWSRYRDARHLPGAWHFLSGPQDATRQLAEFLELQYWLYDDHVMHDFRIVVFDAQGRRARDILWDPSVDLEQTLVGLAG